jgi:hypothetical protein
MEQPSALLPPAMSFAALAMVLVHFAMYGIVHEAGQGTPGHIFQILVVAQAPIVAFFAIKEDAILSHLDHDLSFCTPRSR